MLVMLMNTKTMGYVKEYHGDFPQGEIKKKENKKKRKKKLTIVTPPHPLISTGTTKYVVIKIYTYFHWKKNIPHSNKNLENKNTILDI